MIRIEINDIEFFVNPNISVLEACRYVGIHVPRFCYHETLSVSGNCRMCLVEIVNSPKPVASCALPVSNNLKFYVDTPLVKKARENIIETLLLNHPLDCPICDQGGECDLQDQALSYGSDLNRFRYAKRGVEDKNFGPLIKTIMSRCIHCTRCVRFSSEVAGVECIGTLNRGMNTEVGTYVPRLFNSELSGNVIDLCPVGALTSKPYSFGIRPWELRLVDGIDIHDSLGSNIYLHSKNSEVFRITPKYNRIINNNLISDKARFAYDSNIVQRLYRLFIRDTVTAKLSNSTKWLEILNATNLLVEKSFAQNHPILILIDENAEYEALLVLKRLEICFPNIIKLQSIASYGSRQNLYTTWSTHTLHSLEKAINTCILFSINLRIEGSILNAKLRLKTLVSDLNIFSFSQKYITYPTINFINFNLKSILPILEGKNIHFSKLLLISQQPLFILGDSISRSGLLAARLRAYLQQYLSTPFILNCKASSNSSSIQLLDIPTLTLKVLISAPLVFAVNLEDSSHLYKYIFSKLETKNIYWFNTHGSKLAYKSNVLFPVKTVYEEAKTFINLENRPQISLAAVSSHGESRSLCSLLYTIFKSTHSSCAPLWSSYNEEFIGNSVMFDAVAQGLRFCKTVSFEKIYFSKIEFLPTKFIYTDFYRTNQSSKNSWTMAKVSSVYFNRISW